MTKEKQRYLLYDSELFYNFPFGKSEFKKLIHTITTTFSPAEALSLLELIKSLGFRTSTVASLSISLEDVKEVPIHQDVINSTNALIHSTERKFNVGQISESERFQQSIDLWNSVTSFLRTEILVAFQGINRLNSIYMMAFSGARGNLNQVRQLVALRGLIADPVGRVLEVPIRSNLNEGLSLTEYLISCYGSRKGVIDTAIRTAQAGYLTRRLVEIGQTISIRTYDCQTKNFIKIHSLLDTEGKVLVPLHVRALGRVVASDYPELAITKNTLIGWKQQLCLQQSSQQELNVRSPLTCECSIDICQLCYGWDLSNYELVALGEAVGILAAQAIGEPGTQLTMRTFHTGGAFSGESSDFILAPITGIIEYTLRPQGYFVRTRWGTFALFTQTSGIITIASKYRIDVPVSTVLFIREGASVVQGQVLGERLSQDNLNETSMNTEERKIHSYFGGQVVYKQHPQANPYSYNGIYIVQGQYICNSNTLNHKQINWISLGDHFQNFTYFNPTLYQTIQTGLIISTNKVLNNVFNNPSISCEPQLISNGLLIPFRQNKINQVSLIHSNRYFQIETQSSSSLFFNKVGFDLSFLNIASNASNYNFKLIVTQHWSVLMNKFNLPKPVRISYLYMYKYVINYFSNRKRKYNFSLSSSYNDYFIFGHAGISLLKKPLVFDLKAFHFENILYPTQSRVENNKVEQFTGWVFNTRKPLNRVRGWVNFMSQKLYLQPLSLTLNSYSLKSIKWLLINPRSHNVYSKQYYLEKLVYNQGFSLMPRLFGFEFPLCEQNYFESLIKSRVHLNILIRQTNFLMQEYPLLSYLNDCNIGTIPFQEIQFCLVPFKNNNSIKLLRKRSKHYKISWHLFLAIETSLKVVKSTNTQVTSLIDYGTTITRGTPISWMTALNLIGGELNYYRKTINLINYKHLSSYKVKQLHKFNNFKLGSILYEGEKYSFGHSSWNGMFFEVVDDIKTFRKIDVLTTPSTENLFVQDGENINEGHLLTTFQVQQVSVSDITQGLPRVEKFLEGRRLIRRLLTRKWVSLLSQYTCENSKTILFQKTHNEFSNYKHFTSLQSQLVLKLNLANIVLNEIQEIVLREVQLVYQSQGVQIADKHIEIILRNLTTRIQVVASGKTNFLPGELIYLQQLKALLQISDCGFNSPLETLEIMPIFIGLSACGRGSTSFIASASFQNTRKVLSAAVINHSTDWLRGLKSHIVLGSRIPAGTGTAFTLKLPMSLTLVETQWHLVQLNLKHLEVGLLQKQIEK